MRHAHIFGAELGKKLVDHASRTLFQHYALYQYVLRRPLRRDVLSIKSAVTLDAFRPDWVDPFLHGDGPGGGGGPLYSMDLEEAREVQPYVAPPPPPMEVQPYVTPDHLKGLEPLQEANLELLIQDRVAEQAESQMRKIDFHIVQPQRLKELVSDANV